MKYRLTSLMIFLILPLFISCGNKNDTEGMSGTIGKVEKHHENDNAGIVLRSEFFNNKEEVQKTIALLAAFNYKMGKVLLDIEDWWIPRIMKYDNTPQGQELANSLKDYMKFVKNNKYKTNKTISLLLDINSGKMDYSKDIDHYFIEFFNYIEQLIKKNELFINSTNSMEKIIASGEAGKKADMLNNIREVRDKMIIKTASIALLTGDSKTAKYALEKEIHDPGLLKDIPAKEKIHQGDARAVFEDFYVDEDKILTYYSKTDDHGFYSGNVGLAVYANPGIDTGNPNPIEVIKLFQSDIIPGIDNMKQVALSEYKLEFFAREEVKVILSQDKLSAVYAFDKLSTDYSELLCSIMDKEKLDLIDLTAKDELSSANKKLGVYIFASDKIGDTDDIIKLTPAIERIGVYSILELFGNKNEDLDLQE